jgi:hypothetical protein
MKEIVEIVFEKAQLKEAVGLLLKLLKSATLDDYQVTTSNSVSELNLNSKELLFIDINESSDGSFYFNLIDFSLYGISLPKAGVQIYKYDYMYDFNLHLEADEIKRKASGSELQKWAEHIAEELKAECYYCGLEPAYDENTRIFSGSTLGPLKLIHNE